MSKVQVDPGLAEKMAQYMSETTEIIDSLRAERDGLTAKVASMEKTASAPPAMEKITNVVNNVVTAGMLKKADRDAAIKAIAADPVDSLLGFIDKLAAMRLEKGGMTKLGQGIGEDKKIPVGEPQQRESDRKWDEAFGTPRI